MLNKHGERLAIGFCVVFVLTCVAGVSYIAYVEGLLFEIALWSFGIVLVMGAMYLIGWVIE